MILRVILLTTFLISAVLAGEGPDIGSLYKIRVPFQKPQVPVANELKSPERAVFTALGHTVVPIVAGALLVRNLGGYKQRPLRMLGGCSAVR